MLEPRTGPGRRRRFLLVGFAAGLALGVAAGATVSAAVANDGADSMYRKLDILAQVLGVIESNYVDSLTPTDLIYGAARGAVSVLDEHSAFFTPEEYRGLVDATEGEYVGIGVELEYISNLPYVALVLEGSAAHHAGIRPGDAVLAVDGEPVLASSIELIQQKLRGPVGTKVALTVRRSDRDEPWTFTLVRSWVRIVPIDYRLLDGGIAHAQVKTFSRRVVTDLEVLLSRTPPKGGLVLDLRGNPGGLFDEAVAMCDLFLADGPIVDVVGRGGRVLEHHEARPRGTEPNYPIAILINGGSASAAEVVAGSLADRGRARLFGSRSYGKGSVQSVADLADGSGLKLTVARYATPKGRRIDGQGIEPDEVVADDTSSERDEVLDVAMAWIKSQQR